MWNKFKNQIRKILGKKVITKIEIFPSCGARIILIFSKEYSDITTTDLRAAIGIKLTGWQEI